MSDAKFKNITVQLEPETLAKVDAKAEALDLNRSQYLRRLVKRDLQLAQSESKPADMAHAA